MPYSQFRGKDYVQLWEQIPALEPMFFQYEKDYSPDLVQNIMMQPHLMYSVPIGM